MALKATITVTMPVSDAGHRARDEFVKSNDCRDIWKITELVSELESKSGAGQQRAVAVAKKAGLKPVGRPDLNYGLHGGTSGPIEMWFQVTAEG
jgi:hypothetical protein